MVIFVEDELKLDALVDFVRGHSLSGADLEALFSIRAVAPPAKLLFDTADWPKATVDHAAADRFVDAVWKRMRPRVRRVFACFQSPAHLCRDVVGAVASSQAAPPD